MKIPQPFSISDFRFPISDLGKTAHGRAWPQNPQLAIGNRKGEPGIALVITLIMLAVTLVMAVAFLALARRERNSVTTTTDTTTARLATETAVAAAQAQIVANMQSGLSNFYNLRLLVSTNYINPAGFNPALGGNPTNVSYWDRNGNFLTGANLEQSIANLFLLPRAPVFVPTNQSPVAYDFRYYLDLNENGKFEANGWVTNYNAAGNPIYDANGNPLVFAQGDPEWIGVLEHPDQPHGPNNHFIARYAFIAVPSGNTLDINYIHNQAQNTALSVNDGFIRNQGVGSWEINLAAFLADLNTNIWSPVALPANLYYSYNEPGGIYNSGIAFDDARALTSYRYNYNSLPSANKMLLNAASAFASDGIDDYSRGPVQTNLDYNRQKFTPVVDTTLPWSGADNTNHYFSISDFLDPQKSSVNFTNRLRSAATKTDTYDRYTYYRMLDQLGSDSAPDEGKINLNYSNAVVNYGPLVNGVRLPTTISVVAGAETNQVPWNPLNFFHAAADQLLRVYSANWITANYAAYTNAYAITNTFSITNIPVWVSNRFVYTPAVHRLLQLAANLYDATTNGNYNFPHVFRPIFERDASRNIFIVGYTAVTNVTSVVDNQLSPPQLVSQLALFVTPNTPIVNAKGLVNTYDVPWIIGSKKGFPSFNQMSAITSAQITRKLQLVRPDAATRPNITNQMYVLNISNSVAVSFWNSYSNNYYSPTGSRIAIYAADTVDMNFTNQTYFASFLGFRSVTIPPYLTVINPGNSWSGSGSFAVNGLPYDGAFYRTNWTPSYFPYNADYIYYPRTGGVTALDTNNPNLWDKLDPLYPLNHSGSLGLAITNYFQSFILDGNNVIDYVHFAEPVCITNLDLAVVDPPYPDPVKSARLMWSTNLDGNKLPYGLDNQIYVSETGSGLPTGDQWNPTMISAVATEAGDFQKYLNASPYLGPLIPHQAPFTPSRQVYCSYLLQANDPQIHYLPSDLNSQIGTTAVWASKTTRINGNWYQSDGSDNNPPPLVPNTPIGGRYQPWAVTNSTPAVNPLSVKDPLVNGSDNWDFPTNRYPNVGWIGRVHRGTPWQTVYLKSANILTNASGTGSAYGINGPLIWAQWTGNINNYFDATNASPIQDRLLFDYFTARLNDNSVRGTLPVNQSGLAAWSALFSGMVALSNSLPVVYQTTPFASTYSIMNPAGVVDTALSPAQQPPLWQILNGSNGINATRSLTNLFPAQVFTHVGDILQTPALTEFSPFINRGSTLFGQQQVNYGINDELYEWLPQQMMGLVRLGEPRYVLYCVGQTLKPAPKGEVLSGSFFQLITNYQVVAESAVRAVIRVDAHPSSSGTNYTTVVESYNTLPPN